MGSPMRIVKAYSLISSFVFVDRQYDMTSSQDRIKLYITMQSAFISLASVVLRPSVPLQPEQITLQHQFPLHKPLAFLTEAENAFRKRLLNRESWTVQCFFLN